jgi:hypothetical protein
MENVVGEGSVDGNVTHPRHRSTASAVPSYSRQKSSFSLTIDSCGGQTAQEMEMAGSGS